MEVAYAKSDTVRIAYQVLGAGPPDLVFVPGFVSHLELAWEEPHLARFLRGLAFFSRRLVNPGLHAADYSLSPSALK